MAKERGTMRNILELGLWPGVVIIGMICGVVIWVKSLYDGKGGE